MPEVKKFGKLVQDVEHLHEGNYYHIVAEVNYDKNKFFVIYDDVADKLDIIHEAYFATE